MFNKLFKKGTQRTTAIQETSWLMLTQSFSPLPSIVRKQANKVLSHGKGPCSPKPTLGVAEDNKNGSTSCRVKPRTMENYALGHVPEYEIFVTGLQ